MRAAAKLIPEISNTQEKEVWIAHQIKNFPSFLNTFQRSIGFIKLWVNRIEPFKNGKSKWNSCNRKIQEYYIAISHSFTKWRYLRIMSAWILFDRVYCNSFFIRQTLYLICCFWLSCTLSGVQALGCLRYPLL